MNGCVDSGHNGYNVTRNSCLLSNECYATMYSFPSISKFFLPKFDGLICSTFALSLDAIYRNYFSFKRYRFFSYFQYMQLQILHNSNTAKGRNNKFFSNIKCSSGRPLCVPSKYYLKPLCFV